MIYTLLGIKKGMTSSYDARGRRVGATMVEVPANFVTQVKSMETKDGYEAVQIGMWPKKSTKKPQTGHFKKAGIDQNLQYLKEIRIKPLKTSSIKNLSETFQNSLENTTPGQKIELGQVFQIGDAVKVTGTSKGKGFQGGVKRYNFSGGPKTHGQSDRHRAPGSIGAGTTPGRVYKGKKMAGHMGVDTVSYTGLEVIALDKSQNLITIKGGVPGPVGGLVILERQGKIKGYVAPPEPEPEEEEENKVEGEGVQEPVEGTQEADLNTEAVMEPTDGIEETKSEEKPPEANNQDEGLEQNQEKEGAKE